MNPLIDAIWRWVQCVIMPSELFTQNWRVTLQRILSLLILKVLINKLECIWVFVLILRTFYLDSYMIYTYYIN